jgi:hypothetical protein
MARERRLQNHINEDLSTKLLSWKDQLKENNAKLVYMKEERQRLNARSASNAERLQSMVTNARCTMQMPQVHGTSAVAAFRTGVISIDNAEATMDLVYALGFMTGFFIFSIHPILDRFVMQNKWMDFVQRFI